MPINKHQTNLNQVNQTTKLSISSGCLFQLKSPRFWVRFGLSLAIVSVMTTAAVLLWRRQPTSAVANDTGVATLDRVDITQAGTGQAVTINNVVMDEAAYGTNLTRRTILNNNVVQYAAVYRVDQGGQLTLSITFPVNNTIDPATIGSSQGCLAGSKLEKVAIDDQPSYTNNKATCIVDVNPGQFSWSISANLWGGNNVTIQPSLTTTGQVQTIKPPAIKLLGQGNYRLMLTSGADQSAKNGYNQTVYPSFGLYAVRSPQTGLLGVAPLDKGSWSLDVDTSNLPANWRIERSNNNYFGLSPSGDNIHSTLNSGILKTTRSADGKKLTISLSGSATAVLHCPSRTDVDQLIDSSICYYSGAILLIGSPISSLTPQLTSYSIKIANFTVKVAGANDLVVTPNRSSYVWSLNNKAFGNPVIWGGDSSPGWSRIFNYNQPIYTGEQTTTSAFLNMNTVPSSDNSTNLYYCTTWNPAQHVLIGEFTKTAGGTILANYLAEYGVIGSNMQTLPDSSTASCGKAGDKSATFFKTLAEANNYAQSKGLRVNAVRLWSQKTTAGIRDGKLGTMVLKPVITDQSGATQDVYLQASGVTDQWSERYKDNQTSSDTTPFKFTVKFVPGLVSHTIAVSPTSASPNSESHLTIQPRTYNKDVNVKITTTLPKGLTIKQGSMKLGSYRLVENSDYITTNQADGSTVVQFNLESIAAGSGQPTAGTNPTTGSDGLPVAADNSGRGVLQTPIEFDVLISSSVSAPTTLTISSTVSGNGTNYAVSTFKTTATDLAVAEPKIFGYSLTSSASSLDVDDDLTYTYSNYNLTPDGVTELDNISVLPYNNDSRGTSGLMESKDVASYHIKNYAVERADPNSPWPQLYYTTDSIVRQLEKNQPEQLAKQTSIKWVECQLDDNGGCTNLPADQKITAIRWKAPTFASGARYYTRLTLTDINAEYGAVIGNDISYVAASEIGTSTHQLYKLVNYIGGTLGLAIDKDSLVTELKARSVQIGGNDLTNQLIVNANTSRGYLLTIKSAGSGDLLSDSGHTIPSLSQKPTQGVASWGVRLTGSGANDNWSKIPGDTEDPLILYRSQTRGSEQKTTPIIFGVATASGTSPESYKVVVIYTLTAAL